MKPAAASIRAAVDVLGSLARLDEPLGALTTYRVGGPAAVLVRATSVDDLRLVGRAVEASGLPVLVVGRGSNLLVADAGFAGIAVLLGGFASGITIGGAAGDGPVAVDAGGAVLLPVLARRTVAASLTGFEWAVGVPGSVGGAVRMNAGGHGADMAASLRGVRLLDLHSGEDVAVAAADLNLRFRGSDVRDHHVVLAAHLQLARGDREEGERALTEIVHWRREHQPGGQNAGSVFVNPNPGVLSAGQLIDELGLRGLRHGTAEVSAKHANFIQADEGGSADDVYALMQQVRAIVARERGITLRSEIRLVGWDRG
jgi:UDP-N-acetylmuramate dehydrogenase